MSRTPYYFLLSFAALLFVLTPMSAEATAMTCDTEVRQTFQSSEAGWYPAPTGGNQYASYAELLAIYEKYWKYWNVEMAWNRQADTSNAYICYAVGQGYAGDCYNFVTDPKNPFTILATQSWLDTGFEDVRPLVPPENADMEWGIPAQTEWNSCAAFCSSIEDAEYCFWAGQCRAAKLKPGKSVSAVPFKGPTNTSGTGYGVLSTYFGGATQQAGTCTPRLPAATLTATPSVVQQGGSSMLTWTSYNVSQCTGVGFSTGGAVTGSANVTPSATTEYRIDCTGDAGPASATTSVAVIAASGADLTASGITPTTAWLGQTQTLSGNVSNLGGTPVGATQGYFQLTAPNSKANYAGTVAVPAIAGSAASTVSFSYKFSYEGSYSVRLCADWTSLIAETNEGNNCGPWTDIYVSDAPFSSGVSCTVSPQSVGVGGTVTYTAHPSGAATAPYTWTALDGATGFGSSQTASRTFDADDGGSYGMEVGATYTTSVGTCPIVTVGNWCSGTPDLTITATPSRVRTGEQVSVTWSASGVPGQNASCTVTGPGVAWSSSVSAVSAVPACAASGSADPIVRTQSTYTLTCGSYTQTAIVNVIPNFEEF